MQRYHPRTNMRNPQGNISKTNNQWALPPILTSALHAYVDTTCDLFSSPLNNSMNPNVDYCSTFQDDAIIGALFDASSYRWTSSYLANPDCELAGMRKTLLHALACVTSFSNPFLVVMILPAWEDPPWRTLSILHHPNLTTLAHLSANQLKFIPSHKQLDKDLNLSTLKPAEGLVDLIIVANEEGDKPISTTTVYKTSLSRAYNKHVKTPITQSPSSPTSPPHNKTLQ